jgi:hypothetical protein
MSLPPFPQESVFFSCIIHGAAIHEMGSVVSYMATSITEKTASITDPFWLGCVATVIATTFSLAFQSASLLVRMDFWENLVMKGALYPVLNEWYTSNASPSAYAAVIMMFVLSLALLLRVRKVFEATPLHPVVLFSYCVPIVVLVGMILTFTQIPAIMTLGLYHQFHPSFRTYALYSGVIVHVVMCFHILITSTVLLLMSFKERQGESKNLVLEFFTQHDGFRYLILVGMNIFTIYCYIDATMNFQTMATVQRVMSTDVALHDSLHRNERIDELVARCVSSKVSLINQGLCQEQPAKCPNRPKWLARTLKRL